LLFKIDDDHSGLVVIMRLEVRHASTPCGDAEFYQKKAVFKSFSTTSTPK